MTMKDFAVTDAQLKQAMTELAAGPDAGQLVGEVMQVVDVTPQAGGLAWPRPSLSRRAMTLAAVALLLLATFGAALLLSGVLPMPRPDSSTWTLVVSNADFGRDATEEVQHVIVDPNGSPIAAPLHVPANALSLSWSLDGEHLLYFTREADGSAVVPNAMYVADPVGNDPVEVDLPRQADHYAPGGWLYGAVWSPDSTKFALAWNTFGCEGGPDCMPPGGIDVFDAAGALITTDPVEAIMSTQAIWSPDSSRVAVQTGTCTAEVCRTGPLHIFDVASETTSTLDLDLNSQIAWTADDRLEITVITDDGSVERAYSMAPDGSDIGEPAWPTDDRLDAYGQYSPDGRHVAFVDQDGQLHIAPLFDGAESEVILPKGEDPWGDIVGWSPDGQLLALIRGFSETPPGEMFWAIGADGTGLVSLGVGNDFAWMPRSAIEAVESEPITPSAAPSVEASPTAATAADFVVPFTYTIPAGERVFVDQVSKTQPEEIVRIAGGQSHAIDVLLVTYLHPCPASVPVPTPGPDGGVGRPTVPLNRDPEQFLAYLRDEAGVGITDIREATLGGYPALAADIDPAAATCSGAKLHSNGLGIGGIGVERVLDGPGRLVVARVNSYQAVVAHIWADEELYADWLPTATQIVDSIEFTPSNP